jgi:hypothetical protein
MSVKEAKRNKDIFSHKLSKKLLREHQLEIQRVELHSQRIHAALHTTTQTTVPIIAACTTIDQEAEQGGVLSWEQAQFLVSKEFCPSPHRTVQRWSRKHVMTCIPAAGAAARFFSELEKFVFSLVKTLPVLEEAFCAFQNHQRSFFVQRETKLLFQKKIENITPTEEILSLFDFIQKEKKNLVRVSAREFFKFLKKKLLFKNCSAPKEQVLKSYAVCVLLIKNYGDLPKALIPVTFEGETFLTLKLFEQKFLFPSYKNVFIAPPGFKKNFETKIKEVLKTPQNWFVTEQSKNLSTIRFCLDGKPFVDENGKYSPVSAGHGELLHVFDNLSQKYPKAHCVHIRNIDNLIGTSQERAQKLFVLAEIFKNIRDCLEYSRFKIKKMIFNSKKKDHSSEITDLRFIKSMFYLAHFLEKKEDKRIRDRFHKSQFSTIFCQTVFDIFKKIFYWQDLSHPCSDQDLWQHMLTLLERPLSVLGMVQKQSGDQGGGPVFARLPDEKIIKLCVEMTHISPVDLEKHWSPQSPKITYFNPALAFFELRTHTFMKNKKERIGKKVKFSHLFEEDFWLLSKREYKGIPVCYHETALYELMGNSAKTNLIFIEVPRLLFFPHKLYLNSVGRKRRLYGFDQIIEP